jgi:hypothetical protein
MAETWLKCSACKNPIAYGVTHWICSVSTCNRSRTKLVFCTVSCWDSHVAILRHRDSWAVEAKAPTKEAWEKELAENPIEEAPPPPDKPAAPRRVVGAEPAASSSAAVEREILIVVSKMKKYIKDRSGMNCGDSVAEVLSDCVRAICDDAIRNAAQDERKTVLDRDVPRPARR